MTPSSQAPLIDAFIKRDLAIAERQRLEHDRWLAKQERRRQRAIAFEHARRLAKIEYERKLAIIQLNLEANLAAIEAKSKLDRRQKACNSNNSFVGREADKPRIDHVNQQIPVEDVALRPVPLSPRFASALGEDVAPGAVPTSPRLTAALGKDAMPRPVPTSLIFSAGSAHAPCCATADATPANAASYDSSPTPSLSTAADGSPDSFAVSGTTPCATFDEAPADYDSLPTPQCLAASDDTPAYPAACALTFASPVAGARTLIGSGANEPTPVSSTSSDLTPPCRAAASARTFIGSGANALKPAGPTSSGLTPACRAEADTVTYLALSAGSAFTSLNCLHASFDGAVKTTRLFQVAGFHFWVSIYADTKDSIPPDIRAIDAAGAAINAVGTAIDAAGIG